ncbi:hypothetical protein Tco_0957646, partial [Tanacetum coccineum]
RPRRPPKDLPNCGTAEEVCKRSSGNSQHQAEGRKTIEDFIEHFKGEAAAASKKKGRLS